MTNIAATVKSVMSTGSLAWMVETSDVIRCD